MKQNNLYEVAYAEDLPDFDQQYQFGQVAAAGGTLTVNYDYSYIDPTGLSLSQIQAAVVTNWQVGAIQCPDQRNIQQRNTYEYETVTEPGPQLTSDISLYNGQK